MKTRLLIILLLTLGLQIHARDFVHPGISHKQSDLDRMKYMVEAGKDPWLATYKLMQESSYASYNYSVKGDASNTTITSHTDFINDGFAAYYNALMWNITGDVRHAEKCVEIFNAWVNIKRIEDQFPLNNGRGPWKMLEGAEIIKYTYDGWAEEDIQKFKDMLVYPGWSGTTAPTAAIASKDVTFYWNIYQGDPARHGNQGLFAYRSMMAMGIFCDNEIMYDRALRYLQGLPHRPDDLAYPSGPPVTTPMTTGNEYYDEFRQTSLSNTIEDYGYNEVIANYIWENGQGQESSRDQAHGLGGVSIITAMCEMAWSQGDDLYGHLDNRPLLGLEFYFRYNLSYEHSYPDQLTPWEPTVESGEFIQRLDRTGRWKSLKINPYTGSNLTEDDWNRGMHNYNPIYEMNLGHYKYRMNLDSSKTKWLERAFEVMTEKIGVENDDNAVDHPGWGGIKFRRVSPGDPITGFDSSMTPIYEMHVVPTIVEAENYDYFPIQGEGRTHHDVDTINSGGLYRMDQGVDVDTCSTGGYVLSSLQDGEWLTYTIAVPSTALYDISINYASANANGKLKITVDGKDITDEISIPFGGESSTGLTDFKDFTIANDVILKQGVQALKISISGDSASFVLNSFDITTGSEFACEDGWEAISVPSFITPGLNYSYYEGAWSTLPDFTQLTADETGTTDSIMFLDGWAADNFAAVYSGYIELPIGGSYTFYTASDEGSRLYIDGTLLVDNDGIHTDTEVSGSACLDEGYHEIRIEYFENTGEEGLTVQYEGPGVSKRNLEGLFGLGGCENAAIELPDDAVSGLGYYYYEGTWTTLPDYENEEILDIGITSTVNLNMAEATDYYSLVFKAYFNVEKDGDYTFYTTSDDGSSLYIDGMKIVDNDGTHGAETASGSMCLAAGWHAIEIQYFESTGGQSLSVQWSGADFSKQTITGYYTDVTVPVKQDQFLTFNDLTRYLGEEDFDAAYASSGLPVTYTSYNTDVATVVDGKIHLVAAGEARIRAYQLGNVFYNGAYKITDTLVVIAPESQTITVSDLTKYLGDDDFSPAVASSGLPVTYESYNTDVAIVVDGKIHIVGEGAAYVRASQEGDRMYEPADNVLFKLTVLDGSASVEEFEDSKVMLFPNPVKDVLNVENANGSNLKIYNSTGVLLSSTTVTSDKFSIDMQKISKGILFVKVTSSKGIENVKIIKN